MFLYATLFIICLILAVAAVWFYRSTKDSSKAIYNTVIPISEISHVTDHPKDDKGRRAGAADPGGNRSHQTPANVAKTHAARAIEQTQLGWPGNENQLNENKVHGRPTKAAGHCSLY